MNAWKSAATQYECENVFLSDGPDLMIVPPAMPHVFFSGGDTHYKGNGAAFVVNGEKFLLRLDWGNWYFLPTESKDDLKELSRHDHVTLHVKSGVIHSEYVIPLYESDTLTEELFTAKEIENITPDDKDRTASNDEESEYMDEINLDGIRFENGEIVSDDEPYDPSFRYLGIITPVMEALRPSFRKFIAGPVCSFCVYVINNAVYAFVLCNLKGDWIADEISVNDEETRWFSHEKSVISPVTTANRFTETIEHLTGITMKTALVIDDDVRIAVMPDQKSAFERVNAISLGEDPPEGIDRAARYFARIRESSAENADSQIVNSIDLEAALCAYESTNPAK